MKQRRRIYYTDGQKALMWERWRKGAHDPAVLGSRLISNGLDFYLGADHVCRLYCRT